MKRLLLIFFVSVLFTAPHGALAGDVVFDEDTTLTTDNGVTVTIEAGSEADSVVIDGNTITITVSGDDTFSIDSGDYELSNDQEIDTCNFVINEPMTVVITTYIVDDNCNGDGGGGGGGGGSATRTSSDSDEDAVDETPDSREEAEELLPVSVDVDDLVKLPDDGDPETQNDSAVYYIGLDGKRHPFPDALIYLSWFENFDAVFEISASDMASISLGTPILSRPGTALVKIQSDPNVYAVSPGNVLHWVTTEEIATALYGSSWANRVIDIEPTFFSHYSAGSDITSAEYPDGSLLLNDTTVYYVNNGEKRPFQNDAAYTDNYFQWRSLIASSEGAWTDYETGFYVTGREDALFSEQLIP